MAWVACFISWASPTSFHKPPKPPPPTHFRYNAPGSWKYLNEDTCETKYGRLYDWSTADASKNVVYMNLSRYSISTGEAVSSPRRKRGVLPNYSHLEALFHSTDINNGKTLSDDDNYYEEEYYDVFLFGFDMAYSCEEGYHNLSGYRDNIEAAPYNSEFAKLRSLGKFWLNEACSMPGFHYPLVISRHYKTRTYDWEAYASTGHDDRFGFAVRYVFEPSFVN